MTCDIDSGVLKAIKINFIGSMVGVICFVLEFIFELKGMEAWQNWAHISMFIGFVSGGIAISTSFLWNKLRTLKEKLVDILDDLKDKMRMK